MKKTLLITLGVLILILGIGAWVYFIMYGTPKSADEIFARFGGTGAPAQEVVVPEDASTVDVSDTSDTTGAPQLLKQLTTRPIAGATFTESGIRYVESGTGHIYDIDLVSGAETLVSGTTVTQAQGAVFSKGGTYVAISLIEGNSMKTLVGSVLTDSSTSSLEGITLPLGAREIAFGAATGTLTYLLEGERGSSGYLFNIEKETSAELFTIPLRDVEVVWGSPVHVYTTPTVTQKGYLYRVVNDALMPVGPGGLGLVAFSTGEHVVASHMEGSGLRSRAYSTKDGTSVDLVLGLIPEKCTGSGTFLYCALPYTSTWNPQFPDAWYKGVTTFTDNLWSISPSTMSATPIADISLDSGRDIDVAHMGADILGERIYFINKNDGSLWLYDMTV